MERKQQSREAMKSENSEMWIQLIDEISSLVGTLHDLDNDETKSLDIISEYCQWITNAIPSEPVDIWYPKPIHRLLSIRPLHRIEIPVDILDLLVASGFDVNKYYEDNASEERKTCLHLAVENHHYSAVRWLVQHGADRNLCKMRVEQKVHPNVLESYSSDSIDNEDDEYDDEDEREAVNVYDDIKLKKDICPKASSSSASSDSFDDYDDYDDDEDDEAVNENDGIKRKQKLCSKAPLSSESSYYSLDDEAVYAMHYDFTPIAILAAHIDAPMGLLDTLKTPENINGNPERQIIPPLHVAARHGHIDIALHLIELGAYVNQKDVYSDLPLHATALKGHAQLTQALIQHGASVNQIDGKGRLPLHLACWKGHTQLANSLIKYGASLNQSDGIGNLPLHLAALKGHTELLQSMIKCGASVNQTDESNRSLPLHIAAYYGHTEVVQSLIKCGASVNQEDGRGDLPLHLAALKGHTEVVQSLIKFGASVNHGDRTGDLPLHLAAYDGHNEKVQSLIKCGASVNQ